MKMKIHHSLCVILCGMGIMCDMHDAICQENYNLEQYRKQVLEYNSSVRSADYEAEARKELQKAAKADFKPKISAGGDFQFTGNPLSLSLEIPSATAPVTFNGRQLKYGTSVSIVQPVYEGGAIKTASRIAGSQTAIADHKSYVVKADVTTSADYRYWNTVACREIVSVTESLNESIRRLVTVINDMVEADFTEKNDLLMAEVKLNDAEYQLMTARKNYEVARMSLNSLAGMDLSVEIPVDSAVTPIFVADTHWLDDTGLPARHEIDMTEEQIRLAELQKKLTDSQFLPKIHVGAEGTYGSPGYDFKADMDPNYAVYAKISIPIFEWNKRKHLKQAGDNSISIAREYSKQTRDDIELEVMTSMQSYMQAVDQVNLTESSLSKAEENEAMATARYAEGNLSVVEVLDAQVYLHQARLNYIKSKLDAQLSLSDFMRATGSNLDK